MRAILFSLPFLFLSCQSEPSTDRDALFQKYFQPYPNKVVQLPEGMAAANLVEQAFRLYDEGRYDQAKVLFDELLQEKTDPTTAFYQANTLLALGEAEQAKQLLKSLSDPGPFKQAQEWYVVLAEIKAGDLEKAKARLTTISEEGEEDYRQPAKLLLFELEN